jgi:hypothetical protein
MMRRAIAVDGIGMPLGSVEAWSKADPAEKQEPETRRARVWISRPRILR